MMGVKISSKHDYMQNNDVNYALKTFKNHKFLSEKYMLSRKKCWLSVRLFDVLSCDLPLSRLSHSGKFE